MNTYKPLITSSVTKRRQGNGVLTSSDCDPRVRTSGAVRPAATFICSPIPGLCKFFCFYGIKCFYGFTLWEPFLSSYGGDILYCWNFWDPVTYTSGRIPWLFVNIQAWIQFGVGLWPLGLPYRLDTTSYVVRGNSHRCEIAGSWVVHWICLVHFG